MDSYEMARIPVLIISGPVGIGKSSTAQAISDILEWDYAWPHAVADLDCIRSAFPRPADDPFNMTMAFKNLAAIWLNYREAGARCLIIPSVMEHSTDLDRVRDAVPGADIFMVRLTASLAVNHERIRRRETSAESLEWHLRRSTQLAEELAASKLENLTVDTAQKTVATVAREILGYWGIVESDGTELGR